MRQITIIDLYWTNHCCDARTQTISTPPVSKVPQGSQSSCERRRRAQSSAQNPLQVKVAKSRDRQSEMERQLESGTETGKQTSRQRQRVRVKGNRVHQYPPGLGQHPPFPLDACRSGALFHTSFVSATKDLGHSYDDNMKNWHQSAIDNHFKNTIFMILNICTLI